jgi:hypothetical protein
MAYGRADGSDLSKFHHAFLKKLQKPSIFRRVDRPIWKSREITRNTGVTWLVSCNLL